MIKPYPWSHINNYRSNYVELIHDDENINKALTGNNRIKFKGNQGQIPINITSKLPSATVLSYLKPVPSNAKLPHHHCNAWRRFEAVCETLFAQAGFQTRSQSHGADGGVDIWLHSRVRQLKS